MGDFGDLGDFKPATFSRSDGMARQKRSNGRGARSKPIFTDMEHLDTRGVLPFPRSERRAQQQLRIAQRALRAWSVMERHWGHLPAAVQSAARDLLDLLEESQL